MGKGTSRARGEDETVADDWAHRDRGTYRECLAWFGRRVSRVLQKVTEAPGICQVPVCPARLLPANLLGGSADGDALARVHPS